MSQDKGDGSSEETRRKNMRSTFLTAIKNDDEAVAEAIANLHKDPRYDEDPDKGFISDIMMSLDTHNVSALRKEFEKRGDDGLTLTEFVHVMKHCLVQGCISADRVYGTRHKTG